MGTELVKEQKTRSMVESLSVLRRAIRMGEGVPSADKTLGTTTIKLTFEKLQG